MTVLPLMLEPSLPTPKRERWVPLRAGICNLWEYDDQRFQFEAGRLLLRGRNGAGKSKALEVLLPFLFDADLSPNRLDPFGSTSRTMRWNLVRDGTDKGVSIGYVWLELGRNDGNRDVYYTLGIGMRAHARTSGVEVWYFTTERRLDHDLHLMSPTHRSPLTRSALAAALEGRGRVYDRKAEYRADVNTALFGMSSEQYDALMGALLALRRPQLSKALQPVALSDILTLSLPPLDAQIMGRLADGFAGLENHRNERELLMATQREVASFLQSYQRYVTILLKQRARAVTRADSAYQAARERLRAQEKEHAAATAELQASEAERHRLAHQIETLQAQREALQGSETYQLVRDLDRLGHEVGEARTQLEQLEQRRERSRARLEETRGTLRHMEDDHQAANAQAATTMTHADDAAAAAALADKHIALAATLRQGGDSAAGVLKTLRLERKQALAHLETCIQARNAARDRQRSTEERVAYAADVRDGAASAHRTQCDRAAAALEEYEAAFEAWATASQALSLDTGELEALREVAPMERGDALAPMAGRRRDAQHGEDARLRALEHGIEAKLADLHTQHADMVATRDPTPVSPPWRDDSRLERDGAPLYMLCEPIDAGDDLACLEAALESSGLLDAWVTPTGELLTPECHDSVALAQTPVAGPSLADVLRPTPTDSVAAATIHRVLRGIAWLPADGTANPDATAFVTHDGAWRLGPLHGHWRKGAIQYLGATARAETRRSRIAILEVEIGAAEAALQAHRAQREVVRNALAGLEAELARLPSAQELLQTTAAVTAAAEALGHAEAQLAGTQREAQTAREALEVEAARLHREANACGLLGWVENLRRLQELSDEYFERLRDVVEACNNVLRMAQQRDKQRSLVEDAEAQLSDDRDSADASRQRRERLEAQRNAVKAQLGDTAVGLRETLEHLRLGIAVATDSKKSADHRVSEALTRCGEAKGLLTAAQQTVDAQDTDRAQAALTLRQAVDAGLFRILRDETPVDAGAWSYTETLLKARAFDAETGDTACDERAYDNADNRVVQRQQELSRSLPAHVRLSAERQQGALLYVVQQPGRSSTLNEYARELRDEVEKRDRLLDEQEVNLFESFLSGETHDHLRDRLRQAHALVDRMNEQLHARPTASGLRLRLKWLPADDVPPGTEQAINLLLRGLLSTAEREVLATFLRQRLTEAQVGGSGSFRDNMLVALNYRNWFRFAVEYRNPTAPAWRVLTSKAHASGSGGEKAVMLHMPLFAAAAAFYSDNIHSPRLIMLDEAFAGIDRPMRGQLMGLLRAFDLDFMMTSYEEWGFYSELDGLSTYHLTTHEGLPGVCAEWFVWNGEDAQERGIG